MSALTKIARGAGIAAGVYYAASLAAALLSGSFELSALALAIPAAGAALALARPLAGAVALFAGSALLSNDAAMASPAFLLLVLPASIGATLLVLADMLSDVGLRRRSLGAAA